MTIHFEFSLEEVYSGEIQSRPRKKTPVQVFYQRNKDFRCIHCGQFVSAEPMLSGVQHRNHCPYCLWSRHVDLVQAGDRLAACKCGMHPVGLTFKQIHKKYGRNALGEIMLVHACGECGKISLNRIAADDDADRIRWIFECSQDTSLRAKLAEDQPNLRLLADEDWELVERQFVI
jgi:DNA-directed RNA polymerase subunit RPC12/RpoP